jgi:hypothetical protein
MFKTFDGSSPYSMRAHSTFYAMIDASRELFRKEFNHALSDEQRYELKDGSRFKCNDKCYSALKDRYTEEMFLNMPIRCIQSILESMAYTDYYYQYEKNWEG